MDIIKKMINYDLILFSSMTRANIISLTFVMFICIVMILAGGSALGFMVLIVMSFIPPLIISNAERQGDCEKALAIVPISRRDVVISRFLFVSVFLTAVFVILYIAMEVSLASLESDKTNHEMIRILMLILGIDGEKVSDRAFSRLILGVFFAVAMKISTSMLRKHFKNGTSVKKSSLIISMIVRIVVFEIVGVAVIWLNSSSIPIVQVTVGVITMLISALMVPMDGAVLFITTILIAFGFTAYYGVNAYIDYDKREL